MRVPKFNAYNSAALRKLSIEPEWFLYSVEQGTFKYLGFTFYLGKARSDLLSVGQSTVANWEGKEIDQTIDPSHPYFLQQFFREKYGLSIVGPSAAAAKKDSMVEVFKIAV